MDTRHFYTDANIFALISQFIDIDKTAELKAAFDKAAETLGKTECRIPVLGTQGAGKSSFLNAILFGDILLPVDADETTCIPTEVRYGDNVQPKAVVHFQDGRQKEAVCTEKGLAEYVHQDRNPGNDKHVSHIEIRCKSDLLKKGIILVDLPGVGSLTLANQKTTLDYLKKSSAAIFMLRTVPPITKSEAVFVQSALPLINKVFWVQNQWTDESAEEVQDGCEDNEKKIKDIANRVHKPEGYATRPIVVCVKKALDGRIDDNEKMVKQSQIEPFIDTIVEFAAHWQGDIQANLRQEAQTFIASAQATATEQQSNYEKILSGEEDKAKAELERQYEEAEKTKRENKDRITKVRDFVDGEKATLRHNITEHVRKGAEELRNHVREIIDNGLTGGERLAKAYNDNAKAVHEEIFQELQPSFLSLVEQTTQIISDLKPVSLTKEELDIHGDFSDKGDKVIIAHGGKIG
ncbi:MAG: dynamin family protein, partial [Victivallales bacterium]|nr:dynamin family protein [Victivallales bacterium]